jgi:sugar porter (SP) family MFS transporter
MLVGTVLQTSASTVAHLIVGRIVTGIGNGINTSCVPMYQAETSSAKSRGRLVSLEGWFITIGIVISYWITYGTSSSHNPGIQFRTPIVLQAAFAIVTLICLLKLPESPRWLLLKGRGDEAQVVLAMLDSPNTPTDAPHIVELRQDIEEVIAAESSTTIRDMWRNSPQRTPLRLALGYGIQMMQQLTGINAVIFYVPILLEQTMGLEHSLALIVSGCTGICFLVFTFLPIIYIDNVGRRKPLMLGAAGQSISMMLIAILLRVGGKGPSTAAIIFIFVYIATYSGFGWVAIPWLYPTEINELRFRAKGAALATTANWIWNFAIVEITPIGIQNLGWRFYLIFMVFNACFVPIIYFFYPETAGKTLEELDLLYAVAGRSSISVALHSHKGGEIPEGSLAMRRHSSAGATIAEKDKAMGKGEATHGTHGLANGVV